MKTRARLCWWCSSKLSTAEGCRAGDEMENSLDDPMTGRATCEWVEPATSAKDSFCNLWQRIHYKRDQDENSWELNPWVWVVEFKRV